MFRFQVVTGRLQCLEDRDNYSRWQSARYLPLPVRVGDIPGHRGRVDQHQGVQGGGEGVQRGGCVEGAPLHCEVPGCGGGVGEDGDGE